MHLLAIRFSAMGDVVLTVPVLRHVLNQNPDLKITLVTKKGFSAFFEGITNLTIEEMDTSGKYAGIWGLWKFSGYLKKKFAIDLVIDLHGVMRSMLLTFLLRNKTFTINKGRVEKSRLTRKHNKILNNLKHTTERYLDLFTQAGLNHKPLIPLPMINTNQDLLPEIQPWLSNKNKPLIGIAPLTQHYQKQWPLEYMIELVKKIKNKIPDAEIILFGSNKEIPVLKTLTTNPSEIVAGKISLEAEILLISKLKIMICMDSSNMHIAALTGVPTLSIWGATHPYAGYAPLGSNHTIVQNSNLTCRPCAIFGNKPCYREDLACLNSLNSDMILENILKII